MADIQVKWHKFKIDSRGVSENILNAADTMNMLESVAQARCPEGCSVNVKRGAKRASARIVTETGRAFNDNLKNNTLLHAIG